MKRPPVFIEIKCTLPCRPANKVCLYCTVIVLIAATSYLINILPKINVKLDPYEMKLHVLSFIKCSNFLFQPKVIRKGQSTFEGPHKAHILDQIKESSGNREIGTLNNIGNYELKVLLGQ